MSKIFDNIESFQRDEENTSKNWEKHKVTKSECEQVFFNKPLVISAGRKHTRLEKRWFVLGVTDTARKLFLVFTIRGKLIRVISARDMNKKGNDIYNEEVKKNT